MRWKRAHRAAWLALALLAGHARGADRHRASPLEPVRAKALGGDVREALRILESAPAGSLEGAELAERDCLLATFVDGRPPALAVGDPIVAEVVGIYRDYWRRVLMHELGAAEGERQLFGRLRELLARSGVAVEHDSPTALEDDLGSLLLRRGFRSLRGVTRPYRELMVWGREVPSTYQVALPDETIAVNVVFLHDFVSLGWAAFATCGKAHTGGWAKEDALYCVASSYDTASEAFLVSYLAHEAQHFADRRRFPGLDQAELEYRAKLVELAEAKETAHALLASFASRAGGSPSAPHAVASRRVVAELSCRVLGSDEPVDPGAWAGVPAAAINAAAAGALARSTEELICPVAATPR